MSAATPSRSVPARPDIDAELAAKAAAAKEALDEHVRKTVHWHFSPATGCPFWLAKAENDLDFDPLKDVQTFEDLDKFPEFQDEWLRGGEVRRWVPKGIAHKPIYVFETGGTTGIPKSRIASEDFRIDYELFSKTLPDDKFPPGSDWLMLGPTGPRRLRLAIEHLAQYRGGGICFCIDLDPRWVRKAVAAGHADMAKEYMDHCIDQAVSLLHANHNIQCMFSTPKLIEALALRLEEDDETIGGLGIKGIFGGGTEFSPQWNRFCNEELLDGAFMTPTYGNTLMGLAASAPSGPHNDWKITYYAPQPRAVVQVVDFKDYDRVVGYGETGRSKLTTLTEEFFVPGFMERDEGEREPPYKDYPWDGISGVRPFHEFAKKTAVGVY